MITSTAHWPIEYLAEKAVLREPGFGITDEAKSVRYPVRLLRYWFGYHLLRDEAARLGRPLAVAEIGVDSGQMLRFSRLAHSRTEPGTPLWWSRWLAVDVDLREPLLRDAGYQEWHQANLEDDHLELPPPVDAAICLHVLEHLFQPEAAVRRIVENLPSGGLFIGGFPVVPHFCVAPRERRIRQTARTFGHVSVFSPRRVRQMCEAAGCRVEFMSGAFFMRKKGSTIENSPHWLRFNLWWGATFPWWPGELYWAARKL